MAQEQAHPETVLVTEAFLINGRTERGGWTRAQLQQLGVSWPPVRGWKRRMIGQRIPWDRACDFYRLAMGVKVAPFLEALKAAEDPRLPL